MVSPSIQETSGCRGGKIFFFILLGSWLRSPFNKNRLTGEKQIIRHNIINTTNSATEDELHFPLYLL